MFSDDVHVIDYLHVFVKLLLLLYEFMAELRLDYFCIT